MRKLAAWLATLSLAGQAAAADLSPANWPADVRARLERAETIPYPQAARTVEGRQEVVSATMSPVALHVGMETLRQGGTAADAAVSVALTQVATNMGSIISYAGIAQLVYYDARSGRVYSMDAGWAPYAGETDPKSIPPLDVSFVTGGKAPELAPNQGRKTLTPGFMAGMAAANARFGRLKFATLLEPAIWYAENGVPATPLLQYYYANFSKAVARTPEGQAFLGRAGGGRPRVGERIMLPGAAALLKGVAKSGPGYMYRGPWARKYVEFVRREGGAATLKDLAAYRVRWEAPLTVRYGDATVYGPGLESYSSCAVLASLNLVDAQGGPKLPPYWTEPRTFAAYSRAMRYASDTTILKQSGLQSGDCREQLTPAYGQRTAPMLPQLLAQMASAAEPGHHSAAVVVVDRWGNVAALVHSINGGIWGDTGIVVDDVPIAGSGGLYQVRLQHIGASGHVGGDMAPLIALRNGKPVLGVASIGTSLVAETTRVAGGMLAGTEAQALLAAPPLLSWYISGDKREDPAPAAAYSAAFRTTLAGLGVRVREESLNVVPNWRGTVALAWIKPDGARATAEVPATVARGDAR